MKISLRPAELPLTFYNCACALALAGQTDDAFKHIEGALKAGAANNNPLPESLLRVDMDIASLRKGQRLDKLIEKYFRKGGKGSKGGTTSKPSPRKGPPK